MNISFFLWHYFFMYFLFYQSISYRKHAQVQTLSSHALLSGLKIFKKKQVITLNVHDETITLHLKKQYMYI